MDNINLSETHHFNTDLSSSPNSPIDDDSSSNQNLFTEKTTQLQDQGKPFSVNDKPFGDYSSKWENKSSAICESIEKCNGARNTNTLRKWLEKCISKPFYKCYYIF